MRREKTTPRERTPSSSPRSDAPKRPRGQGARTAKTLGRLFVALLSTLILSANGYAWTTLRDLNGGLRGSDLIGANQPDGATDILLVGGDSRVDARGNPLPQHVLDELRAGEAEGDRTDTMILVRIPNSGGRATAMSFPRDTEVRLGRGYGENKLNAAFSLAKQDARTRLLRSGVRDPKQLELRSRAEGQRFLIQTLDKLAGVHIDHYAEVNLLGFYQITRAIGGVDVCLKQATRDPNPAPTSGKVHKPSKAPMRWPSSASDTARAWSAATWTASCGSRCSCRR